MWRTARRKLVNDCTYIFKAPIMSNYCPLMLWHSSSYLKTTKSFPISFTMPTLPARLSVLITCNLQDENSLFIPCLDELFNLWNIAVCQMNYWVHAAGRYRPTSILERVHKAFFNYYQIHAMTYMPDEIILARMMTTLDLEFERVLHYHDEGYESNNDYGLSSQIARPICIYSVFTTEASFDPGEFTTGQCPILPFTPKCPRSLPFWEGVCQQQTFNYMPLPTPETDFEDQKEPLPTADLGDPVWDEEPVPDSREYLWIHEIPRPATSTPPHSLYQQPHPCSPTKESQKPDQMEVPPEFEVMELDTPEDIPDLLDVLQEVMSDLDAWAHDVLSYQF